MGSEKVGAGVRLGTTARPLGALSALDCVETVGSSVPPPQARASTAILPVTMTSFDCMNSPLIEVDYALDAASLVGARSRAPAARAYVIQSELGR